MGYTSAQAKDFISHIAPIIQEQAKERGYKVCSTIIAQAIIEGAAGTSTLAKLYHNHFGMKCGKSWKGKSVNLRTKEEYTPGSLTTIKDNFRAYDNDLEGVKGYFDFISANRYANLKSANTYREYAEMLKADGYATSSTYVNTLCSTVTKYGLTAWDNVPLHIQKRRTLKKGMSGSDVIYVQQILKDQLYDLGKWGVDSHYGEQTRKAVVQFQKDHGLVPDGIVGKNTWSMLERYA